MPRSPFASRSARIARRAAVTLVGAGLLVVGIVLIVAPGPGLLVLALALFVLGTEYEWARRHYHRMRRRANDTAAQAVARRSSFLVSVLGGLGMIGLGITLIVADALPFSGLTTGLTLSVSGAIVLATLGYAFARADQ